MRRQWGAILTLVTVGAAAAACGKKADNSAAAADTAAVAPAPAPAPAEATTGAAPAGAPAQLPAGVTAEMVASGNTIYHTTGNCFTCHGPDGTGTPLAPDLTDSQWLNIDGSYDATVKTVTTGVPTPKDKTHPS